MTDEWEQITDLWDTGESIRVTRDELFRLHVDLDMVVACETCSDYHPDIDVGMGEIKNALEEMRRG